MILLPRASHSSMVWALIFAVVFDLVVLAIVVPTVTTSGAPRSATAATTRYPYQMVRTPRLELGWPRPRDFKSLVSTNSTTLATCLACPERFELPT